MTTLLRRGLIMLLAGILMMLMSAAEVRHYLGYESARTVLLYHNGSYSVMTPESLVGSSPLNHPEHYFSDRGLTLRQTGRDAQLSMALPVTPIDPRILSRLTLQITANQPGEWLAYLRRTADSSAIASPIQSLDAGDHELSFDLEQILATAATQRDREAQSLSEVVLAPYYPENARVTIHSVQWQPGDSVHRDDWRIMTAEELGVLPGQQLASFHQGRQTNPLLLAPESGLSLMALPRWMCVCLLLLLTASALFIDWRLRLPLSRFLWLMATVGSVALLDLRGLYHSVNWAAISLIFLIALYPIAQYATSRWRQIQWLGAGDIRVLTGIMLVWSGCLLIAWQRPEFSPVTLLTQWLTYFPWALTQQIILLAGLMPLCLGPERTTEGFHTRTTSAQQILPAALLFGWLHYPNLILMAGSAGLAALIMLLWQRGHGWLVTLTLHATMGTLALGMAPEDWLISGDIGSFWLS